MLPHVPVSSKKQGRGTPGFSKTGMPAQWNFDLCTQPVWRHRDIYFIKNRRNQNKGSLLKEIEFAKHGTSLLKGWVIWRSAFPWHTKHKPKISSLSITIKLNSVQVYGSNFNVSMPGEAIDFTNLLTNVQHKLIVQEYEQKEISTGGFMDNDYDFPTHCIAMSYTIQPELADDSFSISDSSDGDKPRKKHINPM